MLTRRRMIRARSPPDDTFVVLGIVTIFTVGTVVSFRLRWWAGWFGGFLENCLNSELLTQLIFVIE